MSDSREAFEKWAKGDLDLQHIGVCYGDETTDAAFRAWQAAQGQSSKPCPYIATSSEGTSWCRLAAQPQVNQQLLEALQPLRFDVWADHYEEDRLWYEPHKDGSLLYYDQVVAAIAAAQEQ